MPKVTMTFTLPKERYDHDCALHGGDWRSIVYEVALFLRSKLKYGNDYKTVAEALEDVKRLLWDQCNANHLDPWEE